MKSEEGARRLEVRGSSTRLFRRIMLRDTGASQENEGSRADNAIDITGKSPIKVEGKFSVFSGKISPRDEDWWRERKPVYAEMKEERG